MTQQINQQSYVTWLQHVSGYCLILAGRDLTVNYKSLEDDYRARVTPQDAARRALAAAGIAVTS